MFEIYKTEEKGEFRYRLKAKNGQIVLAGQGYKQKPSCVKGVESVKKNAGSDAQYECKVAKSGKHFFNLLAVNKQVIGTSQMYANEASMKKGIESIKTVAPAADVKDLTA